MTCFNLMLCCFASTLPFVIGQESVSHKQAYTIEPKLDGKKIRVESFAIGPRGYLWFGCRVVGDKPQADSGHILVYDPSGGLFNSFPVAIIPEAITFSPKSILYVASSEKIARLSLYGPIEAEIASRRLYSEASKTVTIAPNSLSITASEDFVFVSYPTLDGKGFSVSRLSPDLTIEAEIATDLNGCGLRMPFHNDGSNLVCGESNIGKITYLNFQGKRLTSFGKLGSESEDQFIGPCNPASVSAVSDIHVITGELKSGYLKSFTRDGRLARLVSKVQLSPDCQRVEVAFDPDTDWYYMLDGTAGVLLVLLPEDQVPDEPIKP